MASSNMLRMLAALSVTSLALAAGCATEVAPEDASNETESDLSAAGQALIGAYDGQSGPFHKLVLTARREGSANTFFAEVDTNVRCVVAPCPSSERIDGTFTATKKTITFKSTTASDRVDHLLGKWSYVLDGDTITLTQKGETPSTLERGGSYCTQPSDCSGQPIIHPMCVGHWLCGADKTCGYACGPTQLPQ